jgi:hypothetical protein
LVDRHTLGRGVSDLTRSDAEQLVEHVPGPADWRGAVPEQVVRAARQARRDPSRHRGNAAPEVLGELGRDQAAAGIGGLHDERHPRKPGHDPIPRRKAPAIRLGARRELRQDEARLADSLVEVPVPAWIDHVRARGDHRDGDAARIQAASMGRAIYSESKAADDGDARRAQPASQRVGDLGAIRARATGAHDGDRRLRGQQPQHLHPPAAEQHRGRVDQVSKERRVVIRMPAHGQDPARRQPAALPAEVERFEKRSRLVDTPPRGGLEQLVLRECEQSVRPPLATGHQPRDSRGEVRDQEGPPQASAAGVDHAATCRETSRR